MEDNIFKDLDYIDLGIIPEINPNIKIYSINNNIPINISFIENITPLIQIKHKDIETIRNKILEYQEGRCALCGNKIDFESGVSLDHQHKIKKDLVGIDGAGLIRGVLCRSCNLTEGKIWNSMRRFIQPKNVQDRIKWLESLLDYYKLPNINLIHPNEIPKDPKLPKRIFNKIKKYHSSKYPKQKSLEYPKSGKWTKKIKILLKEMENNG